jgi:UDP-glucose 4-epimerase
VVDVLAPEEAAYGRLGPGVFSGIWGERFAYQWQSVQDLSPSTVSGHDVVVHLAAQADVGLGYPSARWTAEQNVLGTVSVLEACREARVPPRLVLYAGTAHELEAEPVRLPLTEESELRPATPYGFSKAAGELACHAWRRSYGVPTAIMSNGVVVGPGMRRQIFLYIWLEALLRGEPVILEGGDQGRDLTYVSDVLDAWTLAIEADPRVVVGEKFQVSYGQEWRLSQLLEMCFEVTGRRVPVSHRPYRPGEENMREAFDISKARRVLGFEPQVAAHEAIAATWAWLRGVDSGTMTHPLEGVAYGNR